ncbi:hypothetical protein SAMN05443247_06900 [Bradyrhizobium erythrophlei]|nr:hypothetical protein SAMN05443247_06900 [Bradyrhizobium erythrophlei]
MPLTIDQLRRATEVGDLPADVAAQVLVDFARYVRGEGAITMDQALGLCVPSGGDPWFVRLARDRRDEAIRALGEMLQPFGTASDKADAVRLKIQRYRPTWHRRDQYLDAPRAENPIDRLLFTAFKACDGAIPDSPDHLRKMLAA